MKLADKAAYTLTLVLFLFELILTSFCSIDKNRNEYGPLHKLPADASNQTSFSIPFNHLSQLNDCIQLNALPYRRDTPTIVIYTFLACKPCLVLAKKVQTLCMNKNLEASQIVFVNPVDQDSIKIKKYLEKSNCTSAYYITKWPEFDGDFPKIGAYDSVGNLLWVEYGYNQEVLTRIQKFMGHE